MPVLCTIVFFKINQPAAQVTDTIAQTNIGMSPFVGVQEGGIFDDEDLQKELDEMLSEEDSEAEFLKRLQQIRVPAQAPALAPTKVNSMGEAQAQLVGGDVVDAKDDEIDPHQEEKSVLSKRTGVNSQKME